MGNKETKEKVRQLIDNRLTSDQKMVLIRVIQAEQAKLSMQKPRGIIEDIEAIVREVIK